LHAYGIHFLPITHSLRAVSCFKEECVKRAENLKKAEEQLKLYV